MDFFRQGPAPVAGRKKPAKLSDSLNDISSISMAMLCPRLGLDLIRLLDGWPCLESVVPGIEMRKFLRNVKALVSHEE